MADWKDYDTYRGTREHTVVGTVKALKALWSPQLNNRRDILVYLPRSYAPGTRRYPVLYMHDGQNLFDATTSFVGEWGVDKAMDRLGKEGLEAIVVGIPNMGEQRMAEYSPFQDFRFGGGRGDAYLSFLTQTLKPIIDRDFRTLDDRWHTAILGSSMGGLISLYAAFRFPGYFALAGAMSPSLVFARQALFSFVRYCPRGSGRIYLDMGTRELRAPRGMAALYRMCRKGPCADARRMVALLEQKGYQARQNLLYVEERGGIHHESAWSRRFPDAIRFLFKPVVLSR